MHLLKLVETLVLTRERLYALEQETNAIRARVDMTANALMDYLKDNNMLAEVNDAPDYVGDDIEDLAG